MHDMTNAHKMLVENFISKVSAVVDEGRLIENPYRNEGCRYNLEHYLYHLASSNIDIMLIGEAPGYRGCALTGIPFTDEVQLKLADNNYALGTWKRHDKTGNTSERSASAMWLELRKRHIVPLMWNIFPFHPYSEGNTQTNRTPTPSELEEGLEYVEALISIFQIDKSKIFAVGKKAKMALDFIDDNHSIRHPANDCRKEFPIQFDLKIGSIYNNSGLAAV